MYYNPSFVKSVDEVYLGLLKPYRIYSAPIGCSSCKFSTNPIDGYHVTISSLTVYILYTAISTHKSFNSCKSLWSEDTSKFTAIEAAGHAPDPEIAPGRTG